VLKGRGGERGIREIYNKIERGIEVARSSEKEPREV
jgi:hypothetical protein